MDHLGLLQPIDGFGEGNTLRIGSTLRTAQCASTNAFIA
jgi:hypothetical protein